MKLARVKNITIDKYFLKTKYAKVKIISNHKYFKCEYLKNRNYN